MVKLVSELRNNLIRLKYLSTLSSSEFVDHPDKVGSAKSHLIVSIEACIDMCNHIISRNEFRVPEDDSDTFRVMGENKIIPEKFADELVNMAKFRNRLVPI